MLVSGTGRASKMASRLQKSTRRSSSSSSDKRSQSISDDPENEDDQRRHRSNPFDSDSEDLVIDSNNHDEILGSPWGGEEYAIVDARPKSDSFSLAKSARMRTNSSSMKERPSTESKVEDSTAKKIPAPRPPPPAQSKVPPPKPPAPAVQSPTNNTSLSDVVSSAPQISATEYYRMQNELAQLKKKVDYLQRDKWKAPPLDETLTRLSQGERFALELYKSLSDKVELLNKAIKMHDGNTILTVVLFLKRTLNEKTFSRELISRPAAVRQYTNFLQSQQDYDELSKIYSLLGKTDELAILQYRRAVASKDAEAKLAKLREVHKMFKLQSEVSEFSNCVQEQCNLLERQITLEARDKALETDGKDVLLRNHPRAAPVLNMPLITTLFYCAYYHYGREEDLTDIHKIKKEFKLTDKQFEWIVLSARSKMKRWRDIQELLTFKGLFRSQKLKSCIGFHNVVDIVSRCGAPQSVITEYLVLVDDNQTKFTLASKLQCHDVAIDTLLALKDRTRLEEYRGRVKSQQHQQKINDLLRNSQIRWKS